MLTMNAIRKAYPAPTPAHTSLCAPGTYDVGGAFMLASGTTYAGKGAYPLEGILAGHLRMVNVKITYAHSIRYAYAILNASDDGNFEDAWTALDSALSERGKDECND